MIDLYLRAESEATLAAALPMFRAKIYVTPKVRGQSTEGDPIWVTSSPYHALDVGFVVVTTPAVFGEPKEDGTRDVVTEAVLEPGFHANLRLVEGHPQYEEIVGVVEPFVVHPLSPQRAFSGGTVNPVPETVSDRQFAQVLAKMGVMTQDEALAFVKVGEVPAKLQAAIDSIEDPDQRFAVNMAVSGATTFNRSNPSTLFLLKALGWTPEQADDLWRAAAAVD